jgi:hypothetical protein
MLPFTREQFMDVFAAYNGAIWPAEFVVYLIGLAMVWQLARRMPGADRLIVAGLALMWLWTGIAYHWMFFAAVNSAAWAFGALFILQAGLLVWFGFVRNVLQFAPPREPIGWLGAAFVGYAAVLYPLVGVLAGHGWPQMPMFGVTPCPVTLFTFGLLLMTCSPVSGWLLAIPFLWSLIGGSAAIALSVPQDWVLLVSGIIAVPLLVLRDHAWRGAGPQLG